MLRAQIPTQQHHAGPEGIHHALFLGIDDGGAQPGFQGHGEEGRGQHRTAGQAEGDVADPEHRRQTQFFAHQAQGADGFHGPPLLGGYGQGQAVDDDVFPGQTGMAGGIQDAPCHSQSVLGRLGNSTAVQGQADDRSAVFAGQGQDRLQALLLARNGVDQHLAVGHLEGPFQGRRIRGIEHQGRACDTYGRQHRTLQGGRFVDAGRSAIEIQQSRSGRHLILGRAPNIGGFAFAQFRGIEFLARRIDAFTDNGAGRRAANLGDGGATGQKAAPRWRRPAQIAAGQGLAHGADMGRGGAATAADNPDAQGQQAVMVADHLLRGGRKHGLPVDQLRQTGVGLGDEGQGGDAAHPFQHLTDAVDPETAVGPNHRYAQGFEGHGSRFRRRPEDTAALVLEGHQGHDWQTGKFPAGNDRGPQFGNIQKGFQGNEIGTGRGKGLDLFAEHRHHCIEIRIPHRPQETPGGPHGGGHKAPGARRPPGQLHGSGIDLVNPIRQSVMVQFKTTAAKTVGDDDIGARLGIFPMHGLHHLGSRQVHFFRTTAGGQAALLEHGAHGAIEYQHPVANGSGKISHPQFNSCEFAGARLSGDCV